MSDPRLSWLCSVALSPLLSSSSVSPSSVGSEAAVQRWLDGGEQHKLLSVYRLHGAKGLLFSTEVGEMAARQAEVAEEVHLIRLQSSSSSGSGSEAAAPPDESAAQAEFAKQVIIAHTGGDAVQGLYELLHSVFGPKIRGGPDSAVASQVSADLSSLESKLHALSLMGGAAAAAAAQSSPSSPPDSQAHLSAIRCVADELDYWHALSSSGGEASERASLFLEKLTADGFDLGQRWDNSALQMLKQEEMARLLDDTQYCLSELWLAQPDYGDAYPQARMEHMLHLLSVQLLQACRHALTQAADVWSDPFPAVKEAIQTQLELLQQWQHTADDLILNEFGGRWKQTQEVSEAQARGAPLPPHAYHHPTLVAFMARLEELLRLRGLQEELLHLLSAEDASSFRLHALFDVFQQAQVDPFNVGPYAQPKWDACCAQMDKTLQPVETHAATALKNRLYSLADKPELLMQEFSQFSALLRRPSVARALDNERRTLLQQLTTRLDELKQQFDSYSAEYGSVSQLPPSLKNQPSPFLSKIIWSNQLAHRIQQILSIASSILAGIVGQERFHALASDLKRRVEQYARDLFDRWHDDVRAALNDQNSPLRLETSGRLMDLDLRGDGELVIHYSESLVTLLREVRQLQEYGYSISESVLSAVVTGEKYYKYGLKLKQVANFYNTIREKILPSQMGMLLLEAQRFERAIKEQKGTRWDQPEECERYMAKLMAITEELTSRNTKLKTMHMHLAAQLVAMLHPPYDLVKNKEAFQQQVQTLRQVIDKEAARGAATKEAIHIWRSHWNQQMYKVLNFQYAWLLETINGDGTNGAGGSSGGGLLLTSMGLGSGPSSSISFPSFLDIPVELKYTHKKLQLKPPMEELRSTYYRNLKRFLDLPKLFQGFYEGSQPPSNSIFATMPERNAEGLYNIYVQAEDLFSQLSSTVRRYEPWVVLGSVDLEQYCSEHLHTVLDWEVNFRALRSKKKESEKLPDSLRIGCFHISFASFKGAIDDLMHKFQEALLLSLKKSTAGALKTVGDFLEQAMQVLNTTPTSIQEMGQAKQQFDELVAQKGAMQALMDNMYEKDQLLRQMANVALDLSGIAPHWQLFLDSYSRFDDLLLEQKETLRAGLEQQTKDTTLQVDKLASRWSAMKPSTDGDMDVSPAGAAKIIEELNEWVEQIQSMKSATQEIVENCESFGMDVPGFDALEALEKEIKGYQDSWSLMTDYAAELSAMTSEDWIAFRKEVSSFAALLDKWTHKLKARGQRDAVFDYLANEIKVNREIYPVLQLISADFLQNEHFKLLFNMLGFDNTVSLRNVNLGHFLKANTIMLKKRTEIRHLVERAQGEVIIREAVDNLKLWADKTEFDLLEQSTGGPQGNTHIIRGWKELFTQISDQQALVGSLKESPYFAPFAEIARQFEEKFVLLDECLHALNQIQRQYLYLEPIFSRGSLPSEQARFKRIDTEFRGIMKEVSDNPSVISLTNVPDLKSTVQSMLEQLDRCQKALNDFLEEKRNKFPRFFFLGNDELLEIIGQSENPVVIQSHLKKLFAGINSVEFSADNKRITAMLSGEMEKVTLVQPVQITPFVEDWLADLTTSMQATLKANLLAALKEFDLSRYPSQILNLAEAIHFTADVEQAIQKNSLQQLHSTLQSRLSEYTSTDTSDDSVESLLLSGKIKALVMDLIHNLDVVKQLMDAKVTTLDNWVWQKQLRFYLKKDIAVIRMVDAEFDYTYEYQGLIDKLVHTPLTDKCYLVLTQGMHLGYGGCPFGPAGTGKTESVKALGNAMGRQTLVFNCDEGIDFQSMGRIFTGLVKCGAWGCFDEFNRLKEDQLSAVSQQIQVIQAAIRKRDSSCELLGRTINVNSNAAIFVTMNPVSREYGGRSRLPHNLKQLFRDISMALPDIGLICITILMAEGFQHAEVIGRKTTEVFNLSKQLLSQQQHYDWGLRALKAVLRNAGQLIQQEKKKRAGSGGAALTMEEEAALLIGSLKVNTLSKLTFADSVRFNALINDVFPGVKDEDIDYGQLKEMIRVTLDEMKLEYVEAQVQKMLQLYAALKQRMGVVVVGPSGVGKGVLLGVLHTALAKMGSPIVRHLMNPKALERHKLLGRMDNDTREWTDGVLTAAARQVQRESATTHTWIISDGDVDPEWVESLNSVLDDNHLLTMPNGERIKFGGNVNFVFETKDLQFASPATVSRMAVIFLSEEDTNVRALVTGWVKRQDPALQSRIGGWMEEMFYAALDWVLEAQSDVVARTKVGTILTALSHLRGVSSKAEFCVGLIRGLGCNLPLDKRTQMATKIWQLSRSEKPLDPRAPLDCYFDKQVGGLQPYTLRDTAISLDSISFRSPPVVETVDVQRNRDLILPWLQNMEPFIVVGPQGAGATLLLEDCFKKIKHATVATIHCSAQTNASHVLQKLNDQCAVFSTNKGRVYRPKEGERLILFLKDLNLPKPDKYDTIQLIEFLQQLLTYKGFYDDNLDWVSIEKIQLVACMNPATTVGRHQLSTRFTATVHVAFMTYSEREQLVAVYTSFLKGVIAGAGSALPDPSWKSEGNIRKLCGTLVDVYEKVRAKFSIDEHRHYLFTPRDLTQWVFGLLRYDLLKENLLDAITYEAYRLFADKLVTPEHLKAFENILFGLLNSQWKHGNKLTDVYYTSLQQFSLNAAPAVADGMGADGAVDLSVVTKELGGSLDRVSGAAFRELCTDGLMTYEREFKPLNIILFPEILQHIALEERVLSRPGGSLFLVGDSGVGRRTSVTLVAHMLRMQFVSPNISKKYDSKSFRLDLKEYLKAAGVEDKQVLMYIEDYQLVEPTILEDINSLLSAGEVAGLFTPQEMDALLGPLKEAFHASGLYKNLLEFFIARVKSNLHVVLSMDPNHPLFAVRCESNPAIFTRCTCLWFGRWTRQGMVEIPKVRLEKLLTAKTTSGQMVDANRVLDMLLFIHASARERGLSATPRKYCSFIDTYLRIFDQNQSGLEQQKKHLMAGLQKLTDAAEQVDVLSKDAQQKQVQVSQKQREADQALEQITQRMGQASERKVEVEQLKKTLGAEEAKLNVRREAIQNELRDIQPILNAAREAVGGIKKDNINEIRAFRMPPAQIHAVLCGVLGLMKQEDTSWQNMKKFLGSPSVKDDILNFDVNSVDVNTRTKVQGLMAKNPDAFDRDKMARVNVAAAPLAAWVQACVRYSTVLDTIKPLRQNFEDANRQLEGARTRVKECEQELQQLDEEVVKLKERFGKMTAEAETLKLSLAKTTEILSAAQSLLGKLSGERNRWEAQVKTLSGGLDALTYDAMLAAAFTSYLGSCPEDARRSALSEWKEKAGSPDFEFMSFMSTESQFLQWKAEGLPSDNLSMENSLLILNSVQVPLVIDPNGSATTWLKTHLADKTLEVVMQQEARFVTTLELAVRFGKTLVVQEVDGLLPMLYPVVRRDLVGQAPRTLIQIGDKSVDYNENFRLFLITRDPQPDLPSDAKALVNEINFSVTRSGLEGQLLGVVLGHEKPQLEQKKSELLASEDKLKIQLSELEKRLLNELAQSEGNILENKSLLESLNQTKSQSSEIAQSLATSKEIQQDLDTQREVYRPIARVGSILYFLVTQLSAVNNMYEFSLPAFIKHFKNNLQAKEEAVRSPTGASAETARVESLSRSLKLKVFTTITRSLFKNDRLMFALHFVHCVRPEMFGDKEWEFLTGQIVGDSNSQEVPLPTWASKDRAGPFATLASVFPQMVRSARLTDEQAWGNWFRSARPEVEFPVAGSGEKALTPFQKLLFLKVLRPDRLQTALNQFACESLGVSTISPPPLQLQRIIVEEANPLNPVLFICEGGADPTQELEEFAEKSIGKNAFHQVALGSGQTEGAMQLLYKSAKEGHYLLLKNLHLVTPWLYELEKNLKLIQPHENFRLILTTEVSQQFPTILLQESLLISYESPPGIKQNLLRTYSSWDPEFLSRGSSVRAQLLFILAWFHAIVQERRTYIPQGWTKFYEFSFADLRSGADILDNICTAMIGGQQSTQELDPLSFPWLTVWGLLKFAIYGGRIDNDHDVRVLVTYLRKFFARDILSVTGSHATRKLTMGVEIPASNQHADYIRLIQKLPDNDLPVLFSLPENVEGAVQETQSTAVISQLRKLAVSSSSLTKFDRDVWRTQLTPILQLWEKFAHADQKALLNRPQKLRKKEEDYTPLEAFIVLENQKAYELVHLLHGALSGLSHVVYSSGLLNAVLKSDGQSLMSGETPWRWAKNWYGPTDPALWITEIVQRKQSLEQLLMRTDSGQLLAMPLRMGQLFTPKVCLNALRQQTARESGKAIDSLKLVASWDPALLPASASLRITLDGLLLQGCGWTGGALSPLSPDAPSLLPLPACQIAYIPKESPEPYPEANAALSVPVYVSSSREEYVCDLRVPCKGQAERWVLAGAALFLNEFK